MSEKSNTAGSPTVVLVHGAFADASSWNGVIERLQAKGVQVTAPANPLRGISIDSAYIAGVLEETPGPIVAVGHSYGGAVITNAARQAKNVVGLVYVAAFATEEGERLADVEAASKDSVLNSALVPLHYPAANGGEPAVEFAIDPEKFHDAFAADLPTEETTVMAATQRPYVRAWDERYRDDGLVVIGAHSPEFQFEHDVENVRPALAAMGVGYWV
jgi:pimeloyl-ACP methyl ester carboxylesterase